MQSVSIGHQKRSSHQIQSTGFEKLVGAGQDEGDFSPFMMAEISTFARMINQILKDEPALQDRLPIDPTNDDLFDTVSDGIVLAYLLNAIDPTLIDLKLLSHGGRTNVF